MKVTLKEPYEAEQFNPRHHIPNYVVDLLRDHAHVSLRIKGYEWAVCYDDGTEKGIHIGDWLVTQGKRPFIFTNVQFKQIFKEVTE
ncbi:hypothetical protein [Latilactobacillus sakei]|uniref:hypothetical protein n=1 Tax=Latilactobacillus sakei TaxID=1599 RepID=UPI00019CED47|nr:hypothetical protein [Latilactobacillus sakei]GEP20622.1 hypothetical protein LSA03nite_02100 [Latilactobacillus sakei subsp. carnosus]